MRWEIRIVVFLLVIAALAGGFCIYQGARTSIHAEHVLHAALLTVQLLDEYVAGNDGNWPDSWADLEDLPPRESAMFEWPKDSREVQQYVAVEFSADPNQLAEQTVAEFDAVRPIGPYYPFRDYGSVDTLLETIRAHTSDEQKRR